jgi:hypothetical protein
MVNRKLDDVATLKQRLAADEWLRTGELHELVREFVPSVSRSTVDRWVSDRKVGFRRTPGRVRLCDPVDVRRLLDELTQVHRGDG